MDERAEIYEFIKSELINGSNGIKIFYDTELIQSGVIDSLGIIKLLTFLEERFGIRIPTELLLPENFETIEKISRLIARLKNQYEVLSEF